jgi:hypothetical protein
MTMQVYTTLKKLKEAGMSTNLGFCCGEDSTIDIVAILKTEGLDYVLQIPHSALQIPHFALCDQDLERRKLLFAVACCQDVWHLLNDSGRQAVRTAHLFAHGEISRAELAVAIDAARYAAWHEATRFKVRVAVHGALLSASKQSFRLLASGAATIAADKNTDGFVDKDIAGNVAWKAAREYQTAAFKTIFSGDY